MAFTLTMPEVGETVTEGTIERWLKQPGETIEKYEPIVEINTDKVNVELPSPVSGTLTEILTPEGTTVQIGASLATIETAAGEQPAEVAPPRPKDDEAAPETSLKEDSPVRIEIEPVATAVEDASAGARAEAASAAAAQPNADGSGKTAAPAKAPSGDDGTGEKRRATPRVRKLAEELSVDLAAVAGTGPGGRIVEEDVRAAADGGKASSGPPAPKAAPDASSAKPQAAPVPAAGADEEAVPLTGIRRTIAQRMAASAFSAPHAWLAVEADVTGLVALRGSVKESFRERHGSDLTYLPFMAHAVSQALVEHPYLNASWADDKIILRKRVNLGIAVATERGLLVPVVKDADRLSVSGLAMAMNDLGERTRTNKLQLDDVQGGTFTLDNTGAFGSVLSMPIINQGQAAIISMEMITKRPVVVGGDAIAVRSLVTLCLSFDHRILDGHQAGAFLADVKRRMEAFAPDTGID